MEKLNNLMKNYKVLYSIGKGGRGICELVEKADKKYVIKKITYELTKEEKTEYQKLVLYLSKINSDNVIKYYESEIEGDYLNILMEYGGNSDLKKFIGKYKDREIYIEDKIIKDIIIQICHGLKAIHNAKIIHRDLSPDNIFINENNKIKIGDFGVAAIINDSNDFINEQIGNHQYWAPEVENGRPYNTKVDIYTLGYVIYELFTLNKYYYDKRIGKDCKINTEIYNPKWQELIDLLLKKDYHERPDIEEVYNMIKDY